MTTRKPIGTALGRSFDALVSPPPADETAKIERKAKRQQQSADKKVSDAHAAIDKAKAKSRREARKLRREGKA